VFWLRRWNSAVASSYNISPSKIFFCAKITAQRKRLKFVFPYKSHLLLLSIAKVMTAKISIAKPERQKKSPKDFKGLFL